MHKEKETRLKIVERWDPAPPRTCYYVNFGKQLPKLGTLGPTPLQ